jgi:hypothetical protein
VAKHQKFPKQVFITVENGGTDEQYYNVTLPDELDAVDESRVAAVYELTGQGVISVQREFQPNRKAR